MYTLYIVGLSYRMSHIHGSASSMSTYELFYFLEQQVKQYLLYNRRLQSHELEQSLQIMSYFLLFKLHEHNISRLTCTRTEQLMVVQNQELNLYIYIYIVFS